MNKQQSSALEEISKRIAEQESRVRSGLRDDRTTFNPIVNLNLSPHRKHHNGNRKRGGAGSNSKVSSHDFKAGTLLVIKSSKASELDISKDKDEKDEKPKNENKDQHEKEKIDEDCINHISAFLNSTPFIISMTIFTIFAMFMSDIQSAYMPANVDFPFDIADCILFTIFSMEILLGAISKKDYVGSFFFWLDVISTLSLLQDISFILERYLTGYDSLNLETPFYDNFNLTFVNKGKGSKQATNSIQKLSSATRATRVLRIIRIVRLIRIVKLYKSALLAREKMERKKKQKERHQKAAIKVMDVEEDTHTKMGLLNAHPDLMNYDQNTDGGDLTNPDKRMTDAGLLNSVKGRKMSKLNIRGKNY
jgi:hypothetical protein